jgi:hypothetical protein
MFECEIKVKVSLAECDYCDKPAKYTIGRTNHIMYNQNSKVCLEHWISYIQHCRQSSQFMFHQSKNRF